MSNANIQFCCWWYLRNVIYTEDQNKPKMSYFLGCQKWGRNQSCGRVLLAPLYCAFRYQPLTQTEYNASSSGSLYRAKYSFHWIRLFKYSHGDTVLSMGPLLFTVPGKKKEWANNEEINEKVIHFLFPFPIKNSLLWSNFPLARVSNSKL